MFGLFRDEEYRMSASFYLADGYLESAFFPIFVKGMSRCYFQAVIMILVDFSYKDTKVDFDSYRARGVAGKDVLWMQKN